MIWTFGSSTECFPFVEGEKLGIYYLKRNKNPFVPF
jgi:hypothetical protein